MTFIKKIKRTISNLLITLLKDEISKEVHTAIRKKPSYICTTADTTVFLSEAKVENLSRGRDKIIIGSNSYIRGELLVYAHSGQINVGDWCYIGAGTRLWSMASISIGNRVLISHNVNIIDNTAHSRTPSERHEHFKNIVTTGHPRNIEDIPGLQADRIVIEDDVWIGFGVTILKGVKIGANSIIYANSVVLHDVPPNSTYRNRIEPIISPI